MVKHSSRSIEDARNGKYALFAVTLLFISFLKIWKRQTDDGNPILAPICFDSESERKEWGTRAVIPSQNLTTTTITATATATERHIIQINLAVEIIQSISLQSNRINLVSARARMMRRQANEKSISIYQSITTATAMMMMLLFCR